MSLLIACVVVLSCLVIVIIKDIHDKSHKKVGEVFKKNGRRFKVRVYDPTDSLPRCKRCDMHHFPVSSGWNGHCCTKVPFCSENERKDKRNVYFEWL